MLVGTPKPSVGGPHSLSTFTPAPTVADPNCLDVFDNSILGDIDKCDFARSYCDAFWYAEPYFCTTSAGATALVIVYLLWIVMLFRLLGSTADDHFAPALEEMAKKMGFPPRFAGVTLLALANGAPDVSATASAIRSSKDGYELSLGALTGALMFVQCVVVGIVLLYTPGGSAPCRGALLRDAAVSVLTAIFLMVSFATGAISWPFVGACFTLYGAFILVVLLADIYHRAVVLPAQRRAQANIGGEGPIPDDLPWRQSQLRDSLIPELSGELATELQRFAGE